VIFIAGSYLVQGQASWGSEDLQRLMATQERIMPEQKPVIVRAMPDNPVTASLLPRVRLTDNEQRDYTDCILAAFNTFKQRKRMMQRHPVPAPGLADFS